MTARRAASALAISALLLSILVISRGISLLK